ncbi:MAG: Fe-S cluster assembly protein SufD [Deltaproteobacteria bacterium]|nr:Fe-S cluster assembly protein SufD [Deltaproteobacteria bacterium]
MDWLETRKKEAAKIFAELPLPEKEEFWRRTNLRRFQLERFSPLSAAEAATGTDSVKTFLPAVIDNHPVEEGVIFKDLLAAVRENSDLAQEYLGRGLKGRNEKFLLQNEANWQTGKFLYIPRETEVSKPILIQQYFTGSQKSIFPRNVIVLDRFAKATLIVHSTSDCENEANYSNSILEVYLEEGANLQLIDLQNFSQKTLEIAHKRVEVGENANLRWVLEVNGAKTSKTNLETVLNGQGAEAFVSALILGNDKQHLELYSKTQHVAPNTHADILVKTTVDGQAKAVFQGMIRIEKTAQQTQSYMANHSILLSDTAHAESIPRLEIEADDVKASHGASVGQVDKEQLFYLRSKGLSAATAERLLIEGFYEEIFGKVTVPEVQEWLRRHVIPGSEE